MLLVGTAPLIPFTLSHSFPHDGLRQDFEGERGT